MATTRISSNTELISIDAVAFMRPLTLRVTASLMKPNAKMYAFFDDVDVNRFFTQQGGALGAQLVTDADGNLAATFDVPGMTFATGNKTLVLRESTSGVQVLGSTDGSVSAVFGSAGIRQRFRRTETTTNTIVIEQVVRIEVPVPVVAATDAVDPLAQSFFTFGVDGGCFITSIDLFFQSKDDTMPVWVELREMANGVPQNSYISANSVSSLRASQVRLSDTALLATNFRFDKMVYLQPDKDYCFVVQSRSNRYHIWTSKLGEVGRETGKIVFEQPLTGSLFKSENNYTWTAEQFEDIKFIMYKAEFDTSSAANLKFAMSANSVVMNSNQFVTIKDTETVYATFPHYHGLNTNSKIAVSCDTLGTYNGITGAQLTGTFTVFDVKSEFIVGFIVPAAVATSTGTITTGGLVKDIQVTGGGSGYDSANAPTVVISGPGTGATASVVIKDGAVVDIVVTAAGTGHTSATTATLSGAVGTGATVVVLTDSKFTVDTNRIYHAVNPAISYVKLQDTDVSASLKTTLGAFTGGTAVSYTGGKTYDIELNKLNRFDNNLLLASRFNESVNMGNAASAELTVAMSTSNKNVSPVIDLNSSRMNFNTNSINNQRTNEVLTSVNEFGFVATLALVGGGAGYTSPPTVVIYGTGTGATATCTISSGVVNAITLVTPGYGYIEAPTVRFTGGGTPTTEATAITTISDYNSEKAPAHGSALSRYITKAQTLANISSGVRLFATAYSNVSSSFEVYIRTSLSSAGTDHKAQSWKLLSCDITRNKSELSGQFKEYEFYMDALAEFDMFSLKFVLRSLTPWDPPIIDNYRTTILAS